MATQGLAAACLSQHRVAAGTQAASTASQVTMCPTTAASRLNADNPEHSMRYCFDASCGLFERKQIINEGRSIRQIQLGSTLKISSINPGVTEHAP